MAGTTPTPEEIKEYWSLKNNSEISVASLNRLTQMRQMLPWPFCTIVNPDTTVVNTMEMQLALPHFTHNSFNVALALFAPQLQFPQAQTPSTLETSTFRAVANFFMSLTTMQWDEIFIDGDASHLETNEKALIAIEHLKLSCLAVFQ